MFKTKKWTVSRAQMALQITQNMIMSTMFELQNKMKLNEINILENLTNDEYTKDFVDIAEILKDETVSSSSAIVEKYNQVISNSVDRNTKKLLLDDLDLKVFDLESTDGIK